jgi:hypothetical protein
MKRWVVAGVVGVAASAVALRAEEPAAPEAKPGAPKIQFERVVYDFGRTSQVASVTGTFSFQNTGTGVLQLQKPSPTCGCTVAAVKPETLQPGEKGELVFNLNVGNIRGHTEKHIIVPSNDPQNPSVNLTIKVDMVALFDWQPQQISLGDLREGVTTNISIRIRRTDGQKLAITRAESSAQFLRTRVEPDESSAGQAATVWVEAAVSGPPRRLNDLLRIYVEGAQQQPTLMVPVFGRLVGDIMLTPEALYWGVPDPSKMQSQPSEALTTRRVMISATQDKPVEISGVASSVKGLAVEVVPVEKGKTYMVVARLNELPKASERGTITIDTNLSSQPQVIVPVTINVITQ